MIGQLTQTAGYRVGRTESDHVGDGTDDSKVEVAFFDILPATEDQRDGDRAGVAHGQEDDTHTGEGVEGSTGSKVDGSQANLDHHTQCHGIQWDVEALVDGAPPARSGYTSIAGEGPGASRGRCHATYTADHTENQQGDGQAESTGVVANGGFKDNRRWLVRVDQHGQLGHDEADRNEEEETGNGVDDNGAHHGLRDHDSWFAHFFAKPDSVSVKAI